MDFGIRMGTCGSTSTCSPCPNNARELSRGWHKGAHVGPRQPLLARANLSRLWPTLANPWRPPGLSLTTFVQRRVECHGERRLAVDEIHPRELLADPPAFLGQLEALCVQRQGVVLAGDGERSFQVAFQSGHVASRSQVCNRRRGLERGLAPPPRGLARTARHLLPS